MFEEIIHPDQRHALADGTQFFDFGKEAFARLELLIDADAAQTITLAVGEVKKHGRIVRKPGGSRIYQEVKIPIVKGRSNLFMNLTHKTYCPASVPITPEVAPFRYAEVRGLKGTVEARQHAYFGPFDEHAASFTCNASPLNDIWELCKYTMKATSTFGVFVDGNRERQAYEGDAYINQLSYLVCNSNPQLSHATIDRLFRYPTWPTEWQLAMIPVIHDYLLYTGDLDSVKTWYEPLKGKLLLECVNAKGLLSVAERPPAWTCPGFDNRKLQDIVDWPITEQDGYEFDSVNLVPNCWQTMALRRMAQLSDLLGQLQDAATYRKLADQRRLYIRRAMLKNGMFTDNPFSNHTALHSAVFPALWDIAEPEERPALIRLIQSKGMACSVFGAQFLLECCYVNRLGDHALRLLLSDGLRSWQNMLRKGATITMEAWDDSLKPNQDWNHPWGAAPANIIVRHLCGIRPVAPGFRLFTVDPQPGFLSSFDLHTPTPQGDIHLSMPQPGSYDLTVPTGTEALFRRRRLIPGHYRLPLL